MGRRFSWSLAWALGVVALEAAADPPPAWRAAWRRTCRQDLSADASNLCERDHYAYDWEPPPPRAEHGLLGVCDGADVFATDAAEFADRPDDRQWARAVAERYGFTDAAPRAWRAPWGDRVAAWSYEGHPRNVYNYRFDVRVVEHGATLYRIEMETLHEGAADPETFPDARYRLALDRGRMDALLHVMFDPLGGTGVRRGRAAAP